MKEVALRARLHWASVNAAILLEKWLNTLRWCLNKPSKSRQFFFFFLLNFWRTRVLFVGPLIPLFWTSGDVSSGFQSQSGQRYPSFVEVYMLHIPWDSPLVQHLLTSWWPAWQLSCLFYIPARYRWDSKPGAIMLPLTVWDQAGPTLYRLSYPGSASRSKIGFFTKGWIAYLLLIRMILRLSYLWKGNKKGFWMGLHDSVMFIICRQNQVHSSSWRHYDVIICSGSSWLFDFSPREVVFILCKVQILQNRGRQMVKLLT